MQNELRQHNAIFFLNMYTHEDKPFFNVNMHHDYLKKKMWNLNIIAYNCHSVIFLLKFL